MGAMPSRAQSEFYKGLLPIELADEAPTVFTADLKNDRFAAVGQRGNLAPPRALSDPVLHWCNCHLDLAVLQRSSTARPSRRTVGAIGTARQIGSSQRLPTRSSFPLWVSSASGWMAHS
jgi:hypothetical protein